VNCQTAIITMIIRITMVAILALASISVDLGGVGFSSACYLLIF
jgi:hypothetical protein